MRDATVKATLALVLSLLLWIAIVEGSIAISRWVF